MFGFVYTYPVRDKNVQTFCLRVANYALRRIIPIVESYNKNPRVDSFVSILRDIVRHLDVLCHARTDTFNWRHVRKFVRVVEADRGVYRIVQTDPYAWTWHGHGTCMARLWYKWTYKRTLLQHRWRRTSCTPTHRKGRGKPLTYDTASVGILIRWREWEPMLGLRIERRRWLGVRGAGFSDGNSA